MGLRRKLDSLDISPGGGDPLGLGLGGGAVRRRMDVKASAAGQVLHRDLKPENSEYRVSCFTWSTPVSAKRWAKADREPF